MNNKKYDDDDDSINEVRLKLKIYYLKIEINLAHIEKRKIRRVWRIKKKSESDGVNYSRNKLWAMRFFTYKAFK